MDLKRLAAERAVQELGSARRLGLGTGSTTARFLEALAELRRRGELADLVGVPTSEETARRARRLGIPIGTLEEYPELDLTVDGADEVDPRLDLMKGGGGAHTREKIVAWASGDYMIVVDESKLVERLGMRADLPVEVLAFGWRATRRHLESVVPEPVLRRRGGEPFRTDEGNLIIDCRFRDGIADPHGLARALKEIPGVVEHGLFLGMARRVVVAGTDGVRLLEA